MNLANHPNENNISPDQYKYVEKQKDIWRFVPINSQVSEVLLEQFMNNGFPLDRQPVCYRNVRELDISDDHNWDLNINTWRSSESGLPNLFELAEYLVGPNVVVTFAAYLFRWFFHNVTSINLSGTIWSNYAAASINWSLVEKLIWQKGLCRSTVLKSDLGTSTNLIELQLDNSTICLPD